MTFAISLLRLEAEMVPSGFYSSSPVRSPSLSTSRAYLAVLDSSCTLASSCSSSAQASRVVLSGWTWKKRCTSPAERLSESPIRSQARRASDSDVRGRWVARGGRRFLALKKE